MADEPNDEPPWLKIVLKALDIPIRTISGILDWRVLALFIVTSWIGIPVTLSLLPPADRAGGLREIGTIASRIGELLSAGAVPWIGWGLTVLLLLVGVPFAVLAHRRIGKQGDELKRPRNEEDPMRLSSRDPSALEKYDERARARYALKDGSDGDEGGG